MSGRAWKPKSQRTWVSELAQRVKRGGADDVVSAGTGHTAVGLTPSVASLTLRHD